MKRAGLVLLFITIFMGAGILSMWTNHTGDEKYDMALYITICMAIFVIASQVLVICILGIIKRYKSYLNNNKIVQIYPPDFKRERWLFRNIVFFSLNRNFFPLIPIVELETKSLVLRNLKEGDIEFFDKAYNNEELVNSYLHVGQVYEPDQYLRALTQLACGSAKEYTLNTWVVADKKENKPIGTISYSRVRVRGRTAEIAFFIAEEFKNKEYISEALSKVIQYTSERGYRVQILISEADIESEEILLELRSEFEKRSKEKMNDKIKPDIS